MPTHDVFNQPPEFGNINLFETDKALTAAKRAFAGTREDKNLQHFGEQAGSAECLELGRLANEYPPRLKTHDSRGVRIDRVEFHPAYHRLMEISTRQGLHNASFAGSARGRNVIRAAGLYMAAQMEASHCCPITMTNAVIPALGHNRQLARHWLKKIMVNDYDPAFAPVERKRAVTFGMGMTEKQGGTDVRTNTTTARPAGNGEYLLTGHKWFMSAPMCDAFLVLAQAPGGLSCFLMPRFLPDGTQNPILIQRLKNKLGNRANASSEVEFEDTHAFLVGDEGRGINTIIEMVTYTRLDCAVSSAGLMRAAIAQAIHHTSNRTVFQKKLIDQPLMQSVLAGMVLDHEAAVALVFRLAASFDKAESDEMARLFARFMTPVIKFHVCKTLPAIACEAMECLGGNGYVEDGPMARLYREAPLNAIWEGSGNVMCLDFARAYNKSPDGLMALIETITRGHTGVPEISATANWLKDRLRTGRNLEAGLRQVTDSLARLTAACTLNELAPGFIAGGYTATRLAPNGYGMHIYGTTPGLKAAPVIRRASTEN